MTSEQTVKLVKWTNSLYLIFDISYFSCIEQFFLKVYLSKIHDRTSNI